MSNSLNLSAEEINQLKIERYTYGDIKIQKRLNAIYMMSDTDYNDSQIAKIVGCHRNILPNWRNKCLYQGLPSLYENHYNKPESELEEHSQNILTYLDENPIQSVNQAVAVIEELTGIKRSPTQIRQFLLRHGYKWRKMGQIPGKADVEQQSTWLKNTLEAFIDLAQKGHCYLFFAMLHILHWDLFFAWFGADIVYF